MESTSEVMWTEQTKSSVSKKCIQEVSASSIQKLSSSSLVGEKSVLSLKGSSDGGFLNNQMATDGMPSVERSLSLVSPIITSPSLPEEGNTINTATLQSEFSTMKLKDEYGTEVGEIVQQKQHQQSVQASSSVMALDGGSKSTSTESQVSMVKQSATTVVAEAQESSSSSSSSKTVVENTEAVKDLPENTEQDQQSVEEEVTVTVTFKKPIKDENAKVEEAVEEEKQVEETEPNCDTPEKVSAVVEDREDCDSKDVEEDSNQISTEQITVKPDGSQTKTVTTVTSVKEVLPDSMKTTVTTSSVTKETHPQTKTITNSIILDGIKKNIEESESDEQSIKEVIPDEGKDDEVEHEEENDEEETEEEEEEEEEEHVKSEDNEKIVAEVKPSDDSSQQLVNKDQIPQESESAKKKPTPVEEETVVDSPSVVLQANQPTKQENLNNTIKDIISSIDSNIRAEENIAALKERELELLKKQQELAKEIEQQQLLAQKLANENQLKQQINNNLLNQGSSIPTKTYLPTTNVTKYTNFKETHDDNVYSRKSETFETRESTNVSKKIDLHKIFTPATDAEEILPKNRKLYASSAFYSPTLHPTVEDQVELARRISHSLSDMSNQQSRGQSMYVNRKKRSVKWVHEGCGQDETENVKIINQEEYEQEEKENDVRHHEKVPLKYLMNPSGQMRDITSLRESINTETGLLSPDVSAEVVTALQAQKGKGAELFAKRRKVSEKWVVDESNVGAQSPSGFTDYQQYHQQPKPPTSPSILPAYTDAAKHRVQLNLHQEQLLEKYAKPGLKVVQTPWEAALSSGSASTAFVEEQKLSPYPASTLTPSPTPQIFDASQGGQLLQNAATNTNNCYNKSYSTDDYQRYPAPQQQAQYERQQNTGTNLQRELAYKPSIPQGWKAPSMSLPKGNQNQISTNITANEMKYVQQQQQQHISTVNEAVKSCEEFNTTDESELIDLIHNNDVKEWVSATTTKKMLNTEAHEFVNLLIKSPELRVSPIPIRTQVIYDNAVQELHMKQMKELHKQQDTKRDQGACDTQSENAEEMKEKVNVRKQLQQYENMHREYTKRIEQEELLLKKREAAKQKVLQHNNKKSTANASSECLDDYLKLKELQRIDLQNYEEYVKIPVKELITNYEQQCQPEEQIETTSVVKEHINLQTDDDKRTQTDEMIKKENEDLYMPKEIPLQSYAPPPVAAIPSSVSPFSSSTGYETNQFSSYMPMNTTLPELTAPSTTKSYEGSGTFPIGKPYQQGFASTYGNSQPPKQQYLPPDSYLKGVQSTSPNISQVNFNPSPLPYDKLAKFENSSADDIRYINSPPTCVSHLNVRGSKVRNTSPAPFAGSYNRPYTPSSDSQYYGNNSSASPRPLSSTHQYSGHNTPNLSHSNFTSNQILNAPSYNTPARGWGCSAGHQYPQSYLSANKAQIVNTASMPYTDF